MASIAVLAVWTWQALTVHYNYQGNWTALFCISSHMPVPAFLRNEPLYIFKSGGGYDGQIYHLVAHDPWLRKGSPDAILSPAFRYQRILVPALAWLLALGRDSWIDRSYIAVVLVFVFLGTYWLTELLVSLKLEPWAGLLFVLAPATVISLDRMTVDVATAALTLGFIRYVEARDDKKIFFTLALLGLTRESGLLIPLAYTCFLLTQRAVARAIYSVGSMIPTLCWWSYLSLRRESSPLTSVFTPVPLGGLTEAFMGGQVYHLGALENLIGSTLDRLSLAGVVLALLFVGRFAVERRWDAISAVLFLLAAPVVFIRAPGWTDTFGFARTLSPLLLALAWYCIRNGWTVMAALTPVALLDVRIAANFVGQLLGVARGALRLH